MLNSSTSHIYPEFPHHGNDGVAGTGGFPEHRVTVHECDPDPKVNILTDQYRDLGPVLLRTHMLFEHPGNDEYFVYSTVIVQILYLM